MTATLRDPTLTIVATVQVEDTRTYPAELTHDGKHYRLSASPPNELGTYHEVPPDGHLRHDGRPMQTDYDIVPVQGIESRRL